MRCQSLLVMLLTLAVASEAAQELDRTTGQVVGEKPPFKPLPVTEDPTVNVLWDLTHGVYFSYEPTGDYSELVMMLADNGYTVGTTAAGIDNMDLTAYSVLVICLGSAWDSPYTASEVEAVQNFIASGKGILVMADNPGAPNVNIHPITQAFGATCGTSLLGPLSVTFSNFAAHPIFSGVSSVIYWTAGELDAAAPSVEVAFTDANQATVADLGPCSMVITGDINFCENGVLTTTDNGRFMLNIMNALSAGACNVGVEQSTWGALKTLYR